MEPQRSPDAPSWAIGKDRLLGALRGVADELRHREAIGDAAAEPDDADGQRRLTRLANAFSKRVRNHAAAVSLYFLLHELGPTP